MKSLARASSSGDVAVVGAGIVGVCIAHALQKRGLAVTLFDRDTPGAACSSGNSGAISVGSVAPLALPGILTTVPRMLGDPQGPLHIPWNYAPHALPWLLRFVASARPARVQQSAAMLAELHRDALAHHETLAAEVGVPDLLMRRGHLFLYPNEAAAAKDATAWRLRESNGYPFEECDREAILALEPHIPERYRCGRFLADHATILNPRRYVEAIARGFTNNGGQFKQEEVRTINPTEGKLWSIEGTRGSYQFRNIVVSAGAWSRKLLRPLGINLMLESQRGYHVQYSGGSELIGRTVVLADHKVFVTPMEQGLRVGGTVEFGGLQRPPSWKRANTLHQIACHAFPSLRELSYTRWMGHRPCMPDSIPVIGPVHHRSGLWLAVGHGHLGLTQAPTTAERLAGLIVG